MLALDHRVSLQPIRSAPSSPMIGSRLVSANSWWPARLPCSRQRREPNNTRNILHANNRRSSYGMQSSRPSCSANLGFSPAQGPVNRMSVDTRPVRCRLLGFHDLCRIETDLFKSLGCVLPGILKCLFVFPHCCRHEVAATLAVCFFIDVALNKSRQCPKKRRGLMDLFKKSGLRLFGHDERIDQHRFHSVLLSCVDSIAFVSTLSSRRCPSSSQSQC